MKKEQSLQGNIKNVFKNTDESVIAELMDRKLIKVICTAETTETTLFKKSHSSVQ